MLARASPRPCSTAGAVNVSGGAGLARACGAARSTAGVKLVAARQGRTTTIVVAAAAGERRTSETVSGGSAVAVSGNSLSVGDHCRHSSRNDSMFRAFSSLITEWDLMPDSDEDAHELRLPELSVHSNSPMRISTLLTSTVGKSTNILWHDCPIGQNDRQNLLNQKGCVVWITGLSGSGKSTLACALSRELHIRGHLTYVLDGDNLRHGLNRDLSFKAEDRAENIRRVGEVAKLFADAGLICIASLISPYRSDRSACRSMLPKSSFIEVFLNAPLEVCEARDPKGLYKLARAGKIKGFTGIDDPYEPPSNCEIVIQCKVGDCPSPKSMADQVVSYLETNGFLRN